jgi:hypoxanthine phosphoribosyltransferase
MDEIIVHGKRFIKYIDAEEISARIRDIGQDLSYRYKNEQVIVLGVLNGAFVFMADLIRHCDFEIDCRFIKIKSYHGMESSGAVSIDNPDALMVEGAHLLIIEDIIDTGLTMEKFLEVIKKKNPKSVSLLTLLHKPESMTHDIKIDTIGFSIPPLFVIGYGLDYDGFGRNLPHIYQLKN